MSHNTSKAAIAILAASLTVSLAIYFGNKFLTRDRASTDQTVLGVVGDRQITLAALRDFLLEKYKSPARVDTLHFDEFESALKELVEWNLLVAEAYRRSADRVPDVVRKINFYENVLLNERLVEKCVVDSILTAERLKEFYERYGGEIRLRQIYISAPSPSIVKAMSSGDKLTQEKARDLAYSILEKLRRGESFPELARRYSEDARTSSRGGDLGFVRWGQLNKDVQEAAFQLQVGEISEPVRSSFGYHILQVTARKKRPFSEEIPVLKTQLAAVYQKLIQNRKEQLYFRLEKKYGATLHTQNLNALAQKAGSPKAPFAHLTEKDRYLPLASFRGGEIVVADFLEAVDKQVYNYLWNVANIQKWVRILLRRAIGAHEASRLGIDVADEVQRFREQVMVEWLKDAVLRHEQLVTEQELRHYYETHQEAFVSPEQLRLRLILMQDSYLAPKVADRARKGENFAELASFYSTHSASKKRGGDLGYIERQQYPELFDLAKDLNKGDILGPVYMTEGIAIIQLLDRRPPKTLAFNEAKSKLYTMVVQSKTEESYRRLLQDLRVKYPVRIDQSVVKRVFERGIL